MKEIATLPPLEELRDDVPLSPRTGEPRRPAAVMVAAVVGYVTVAAIAASYGWHWYRAAYSETYPVAAHLIQWVEPAPGKALSLTLEFVFAALAGLTGGAAGIVGYHAWAGRRWTRWGAVVALTLAGAQTALVNWWGLTAVGLVLVLGVLLFLPPVGRYFDEWDRVRAHTSEGYRRPATVFYGRLPRFR